MLLVLFVLFIVPSCKKDTSIENQTVASIGKSKNGKQLSSVKENIKDWIADHDQNLSAKNKKTLGVISDNLRYDDATVESRNNGEDIIIIPIQETAKEHLNLNAKYLKINSNSVLNLIIIRSTSGKLRWSSIISYHPKDGEKRSSLSEGTMQNILNNEPVADEGMFKFIDLNGRLQQQMEYKKGKISSWGTTANRKIVEKLNALRAKKKQSTTAKKNNQPTLKNAPLPEDCEDIFLVTTYYDGEGGTYEDWEYLYTECDGETGGGGGGGTTIEEDPDAVVETEEEFITYLVDNSDNGMSVTSGPSYSTPEMPVVRCRARIGRTRPRRLDGIRFITAIIPEKAFLQGLTSVSYDNPFKGLMNRSVVIVVDLPAQPSIHIGRQTGSITWSWEQTTVYYVFSPPSSETEHSPGSRSAYVHAYMTGNIEY